MKKKKISFKKGDFIQVWQPCAGRIKRINKKIGYTLDIFPLIEYETSYYVPDDLVIIKKADLYKYCPEKFIKELTK